MVGDRANYSFSGMTASVGVALRFQHPVNEPWSALAHEDVLVQSDSGAIWPPRPISQIVGFFLG